MKLTQEMIERMDSLIDTYAQEDFYSSVYDTTCYLIDDGFTKEDAKSFLIHKMNLILDKI